VGSERGNYHPGVWCLIFLVFPGENCLRYGENFFVRWGTGRRSLLRKELAGGGLSSGHAVMCAVWGWGHFFFLWRVWLLGLRGLKRVSIIALSAFLRGFVDGTGARCAGLWGAKRDLLR